MTSEKIREVIERYRQLFEAEGIEKTDYSHEELLESPELGLAHCPGMLDKMLGFLEEGRVDKAHRWLGFMQGVLWVNRMFTLDELMEHNRSTE